MILSKNYLFQNINGKLNSKTWMTLKSSVVIFQALEPLLSQWPRQPHFIKKFTHPDGWIIPTTKMTNTSSFLRNRSSKIQWFTDIWYPFCQRLWRPAYVIFLKTGWWNSNFQTSWTQSFWVIDLLSISATAPYFFMHRENWYDFQESRSNSNVWCIKNRTTHSSKTLLR